MKQLDTLLSSSAIHALGWVLLHSLWQGFVLAVLLKTALSVSKKTSANTRYLISCLTLFTMGEIPRQLAAAL